MVNHSAIVNSLCIVNLLRVAVLVKNAPACYQRPEMAGLRIFHKKNNHQLEILEPWENAPEIPENTQHGHFCYFRGILLSETGRIRFRRVRFQTPNSVSFLGLTEFRGANSVSSSRPIICVPKRTHRVFRRTHRVCRKTQWVLFSETVLSKQYSARFLFWCFRGMFSGFQNFELVVVFFLWKIRSPAILGLSSRPEYSSIF